jgi:hypothetical protein
LIRASVILAQVMSIGSNTVNSDGKVMWAVRYAEEEM